MIDLDSIDVLSDSERAAIRKHCRLSGSIVRILDIRTFLIEQIHEKRSVFKRRLFKIHDPKLQLLYGKILFGGEKHLTSYSSFPCCFRSYLENVLFQEVPDAKDRGASRELGFNMTAVYYNTQNVRVEEMHTAKKFDTAEWELTDEKSDRDTLLRFRDEFLGLMQSLTDIVEENWRPMEEVNKLKKEIRCYKKATESV